MTSMLYTGNDLRRRVLAVAAVSLPLWLVGCFHDGDGDGDGDEIVPRSIDFCRLQSPATIDGIENSVVTVLGRVYSAGLTDLSGVNDPDPAVIGAVGVGPNGSNPAIDPGWTWFDGVPNPGYGLGSPDYEASADEYQADLVLPGPPGDYDFAFRFTGDAGSTFTYCDTGLGTVDGYNPADAGQLTSSVTLLFREYIDGSGTNKAVEVYGASAGSVDLSACEVRVHANGSATPTATVTLTGNLAPGDLHVVCNAGAGPIVLGACDTQSVNLDYDGNDAMVLACAGRILDVIGRIGEDPGPEWFGGGVGTASETLRRDCLVNVGDSNGTDPFDPSVEWTSTLVPDFSNIGIDHCP